MKFTFLFCLALLFVTCSDDNSNTCSVDDPVNDLPWLKAITKSSPDNPADLTVEQGTFFFRTVFITIICCPTCSSGRSMNYINSVYTCEGEAVDGLSPDSKAIKDRKVIWRTPAEEADCW